jgi:hypothetical protein
MRYLLLLKKKFPKETQMDFCSLSLPGLIKYGNPHRKLFFTVFFIIKCLSSFGHLAAEKAKLQIDIWIPTSELTSRKFLFPWLKGLCHGIDFKTPIVATFTNHLWRCGLLLPKIKVYRLASACFLINTKQRRIGQWTLTKKEAGGDKFFSQWEVRTCCLVQ